MTKLDLGGTPKKITKFTAVVLKLLPAGHMWPARPSGVARETIFIGKKT